MGCAGPGEGCEETAAREQRDQVWSFLPEKAAKDARDKSWAAEWDERDSALDAECAEMDARDKALLLLHLWEAALHATPQKPLLVQETEPAFSSVGGSRQAWRGRVGEPVPTRRA